LEESVTKIGPQTKNFSCRDSQCARGTTKNQNRGLLTFEKAVFTILPNKNHNNYKNKKTGFIFPLL